MFAVTRSQVKIGLSGRWLAYTLQSGGGEACSCHVIDLTSGQRLEAGELPSIVSVEWLQDGSSLAYTLPDADGRPHKVAGVFAQGTRLWVTGTPSSARSRPLLL